MTTTHEQIEAHKEECKKEWPNVCVPWPTPKQWMGIIGLILAGVGGTVAAVWRASEKVSAMTTEIISLSGRGQDHENRLKELEKQRAALLRVEQNTDEILKLLDK